MKKTKKLVSLLLALCLALSLGTAALAKTSSEAIEAPAGDAEVFAITVGANTVRFTWDDISGKGAYASVTGTYAAKVNGEQTTEEWTGVALAELLAAAEKQTGVTFDDAWKISAEAADGFKSVFTVGDARDAENAYIVAPDPVKNFDGETQYDDTYVRILCAAETSNKANIRCITGITTLDENGDGLMTITTTGPVTEPLFDDVAAEDWFCGAVKFAVDNGLMNGVGENLFDPSGLTTRGMVVTILYRLAGSPAVSGESKFWDVTEGDWYYEAVLWANENGIAHGYDEIDPQIKGGGGAFGAKDYITRAQFATMLYRYEQLQGGGFSDLWSFELEYDDVGDIAEFALEPISWCVMNGIIKGRTETTIVPAGSATRAEIATMFMRYMQPEA